mmetsp:Transcript_6544/g.26276  ORF Transcript_6544/g.26276 Transcript_6544/m.26276 type:complete len:171 (+) Transcript_6544:366-878(+)
MSGPHRKRGESNSFERTVRHFPTYMLLRVPELNFGAASASCSFSKHISVARRKSSPSLLRRNTTHTTLVSAILIVLLGKFPRQIPVSLRSRQQFVSEPSSKSWEQGADSSHEFSGTQWPSHSLNVEKQQFWEKGFVVLRGVFGADEMQHVRQVVVDLEPVEERLAMLRRV